MITLHCRLSSILRLNPEYKQIAQYEANAILDKAV